MRLAQLTGLTNPSSVFRNYATLPENVANRFIIYAIGLAGIVFFVRIVISGYNFLTSVGDPAKIQSATKNFVNSLLGFGMIVLSYFIAQIIFRVLGIGEVV